MRPSTTSVHITAGRLKNWGFDDPAELFANDEWTWKVFYDMCLDFSDPDADRYAIDGWEQALPS